MPVTRSIAFLRYPKRQSLALRPRPSFKTDQMLVAQPSRLEPTWSEFADLESKLEKRNQDIRRGWLIGLNVPRGRASRAQNCSRSADRALVTGGMRHARSGRTPHINAGKQENPDDVDEMPVPGGKLEAKMLGRREVSKIGTQQAHNQERRADDDMRAMKARRHEESGAVDVAAEIEPGMAVFVGLHAGECQSKHDRQD